MKRFFFLLGFIYMTTSFAQTNNITVQELLNVGDEHLVNNRYMSAVRTYKEALDMTPTNIEVQYQLAECYRLIQDYESAESYYEMIGKSHDIRFPLAGFYYAMVQKLKGKYDQALQNFKFFRKFIVANDLHESEKYRDHYKQAKIEINGCQLALNQITLVHPDYQFSILEAPLNSESNDYATFSVGSSSILCVTSARGSRGESLGKNQYDETFSNLFRFIKQNNKWVEYDKNDRFEKMVNTKFGNYHSNGSGSFNKERNKFYYTNCNKEFGDVCHIYVSRLMKGKWSKSYPLNLNINQEGFNSKHPNLTTKGDTLFYVSDREGGLGQLDIYMSINAGDENWGSPINLGTQINTPHDEMSPFYEENEKVLFFASNGHVGFGGFDIFIARGVTLETAEIYNAGIPFNSYCDDIFFSIGKSEGYLSSNRKEGLGKFDIYGFNIRSKSDVISEISNESTIAGRNSLFSDDYNFDNSETEIINQIISRMLWSSISEVDLILTERQISVYNFLTKDDEERIKRIVNSRVRKMTSNMIHSIRSEDNYYYNQLSTDKRRKVDKIVSTYLEKYGMSSSVNLSDDEFNLYAGVETEEYEKVDKFISNRLKNAKQFKPETPAYNSFPPSDQKNLDGIVIKYLKQKKNIESIFLDIEEYTFINDNEEQRENVNVAIRERLIGLSNEEKYKLIKEDKDYYASLKAEDREKLKSVAATFMISDLSNFDQNVINSDLAFFKEKNTKEQNKLNKLLLKYISNITNSSIYLTETTFTQSELRTTIGNSHDETVNKLFKMKSWLSVSQKDAVQKFVKTTYNSYLDEAQPVFFKTSPKTVMIPELNQFARLTSNDINQYNELNEMKKRVIDNIIALDYITGEYSDQTVRQEDEHRLTKINVQEKVHIAALTKKVSGKEIKSGEQAFINNAIIYYNNLSQDRKTFINRIILDKGLSKRNGNYILPKIDAHARDLLSSDEKSLLKRIKIIIFNNDRILTENLTLDAKDVDTESVDIIALANNIKPEVRESQKLLDERDILVSEELEEIKINLPIDKFDGYDQITISGKLVGSDSGQPLSSYAITLVQFDDSKTTIESYTNAIGTFEFEISPTKKCDLIFKKTIDAESIILEDFNVKGREEKESAKVFTNATKAFFDVNSSELRPEGTILLDEVIKAFSNGGIKIEIESHTDNTGEDEYNLILSKDRANAARKYLISKGIDRSNISVTWHGAEKPIADNGNPYGRQLNRHIGIRLISRNKKSFGNLYLIRSKATVAKISSSMQVPMEEIRYVNGLADRDDLEAYRPIRIRKSDNIEINFKLVVPVDILSISNFIYTVKAGDNLKNVSEKFNVSEKLIMEQNEILSTQLEPGTSLIIYPELGQELK